MHSELCLSSLCFLNKSHCAGLFSLLPWSYIFLSEPILLSLEVFLMSDWHLTLLSHCATISLTFLPPKHPYCCSLSLLSGIHSFISQIKLCCNNKPPDIFVVYIKSCFLIYFSFSFMLSAGQLQFCSTSSSFWDLDWRSKIDLWHIGHLLAERKAMAKPCHGF